MKHVYVVVVDNDELHDLILARVRKRLSPLHPPDYAISQNITDDFMETLRVFKQQNFLTPLLKWIEKRHARYT